MGERGLIMKPRVSEVVEVLLRLVFELPDEKC